MISQAMTNLHENLSLCQIQALKTVAYSPRDLVKPLLVVQQAEGSPLEQLEEVVEQVKEQ